MTMRETLKAALVFAASAATVACVMVQPRTAPAPLQNGGAGGGAPVAPQGAMRAGMYHCSLEDGGYRYPDFPCVVNVGADGATSVEKLAGSQRFRGNLTAAGDGVAFEGQFYCPYGDCNAAIRGSFRRTGEDVWEGTFEGGHAPMIVRMVYAADAYGGGVYGGGRYGGGVYGGGVYGGGPYGGGPYGRGGITHCP